MRAFQLCLLASFIMFGCKFMAAENQQQPDPQKVPDESMEEPALPQDFPFFTMKTGRTAARKAYRAVLNREPSEEETTGAAEKLYAKQAEEWWNIIDSLVKSDEFKNQVRPLLTESQLLENFFQGFLGREPEPSGIETFLPWISKGFLSQAARVIGSGDEFVSKNFVYPQISQKTVEKAVERAYRAILWRSADFDGLKYYSNLIANQGMTGWRTTIQAMAVSTEFKEMIRPNKSNGEILNNIFTHLLGRQIDQEALAILLPLMEADRVDDAFEITATGDEYFEYLVTLQDDRPAPPPGLKIAITGDQGHFDSTRQVYKLIKRENAELLVILGDFDYQGDPNAWEKMMNEELEGDKFPLLGIIGNHDTSQWTKPIGYRNIFTARQQHMPGLRCNGDYGVNSVCVYKNIFFAMSGIGTYGSGHEAYLKAELPKTNHMWKICAWHKLQEKMQVGGKHDETGWPVYEICRENGAIVATAHEHSYSRTHLMSSFEKQAVDSTSNTLQLAPGRSFAFVSGLGGHSVRDQKHTFPWMASLSTSTQGGTHGVLFCTFNVENEADRASCYFKNVRGDVIDQFTIIAPPKQ